MKKAAFLLAVVMLMGLFGCGKPEVPEESTTGTNTEVSASTTTTTEITTTKEAVSAYVSLDEVTVDVILQTFRETGSFSGTVIYYDERDFGEDFAAFRENAENGKGDAVIIVEVMPGDGYYSVNGVQTTAEDVTYLAYKDGQYGWMSIRRYGDGTWEFQTVPDYKLLMVREYMIFKETFTRIYIYMSDTVNYEDGFLLTGYLNPVCYTVDMSIDVSTIPTVTHDIEQIKALLYAYGGGSNVPENFPPVYMWDDEYENAEAFLEFYEKVMAGTECAVVCRMRAENDSFELQYVAYKDGKFLYIRDTTRVVNSKGEMGYYVPSEWGYLVKFEDVSIFSVIYMLVNDDTVTYEQIRDSMFAADQNKWIANQRLYSVRKE